MLHILNYVVRVLHLLQFNNVLTNVRHRECSKCPPCSNAGVVYSLSAAGHPMASSAHTLQPHFYRATLCVSMVFAVARCLSVHPSRW